jgi:hypothetical protein
MKQKQHCIFIPDDDYELHSSKSGSGLGGVVLFLTAIVTGVVITIGVLV